MDNKKVKFEYYIQCYSKGRWIFYSRFCDTLNGAEDLKLDLLKSNPTQNHRIVEREITTIEKVLG